MTTTLYSRDRSWLSKSHHVTTMQLSLRVPKHCYFGEDDGERFPFTGNPADCALLEIRNRAAEAAFRTGSFNKDEAHGSADYILNVGSTREDGFRIILSMSCRPTFRVPRDRCLMVDQNMLYTMHIDRPEYVFSVAWDSKDSITVLYFSRGDWEQELLSKLREQD